MTGLLVVVGLIALAIIAPRYGVDLRDGGDWRSQRDRSLAGPRVRYTARSDLAALSRWVSWVGSVLARRWEAQERAWGAAWQTYQPWRGDDRPPRLDVAPARDRHPDDPGGISGGRAGGISGGRDVGAPGGRPSGRELGAGERGRHRGELRWRPHRGSWRLEGRHLPATPSTGGPASEHPAR
jgi:hypothetical protein